MRVFFAVDLPPNIQKYLFQVARALKGRYIRTVPPENLHITLKFLGEQQPEKVDQIITLIRKVPFKEFDIVIHGIGAFPNKKHARVIWAGADSKELSALVKTIEEHLSLSHEPFKGHVTLARLSGNQPNQLQSFFSLYKDVFFGSFKCTSFALKQSKLTPIGPIYETLFQFTNNPSL
ncbi:MAG: RNA 2',3'-cyclic phosphodiesterase [Candidatus Anstonellales archaeon]